MAENLSQLDSQRVDAALATWRQWHPRPAQRPRVIARLGGESNLCFRVSDDSTQWALRLNAKSPPLGVSRESELAAHSAAALAGLAPPVVYSSDECLVTPLIEGVGVSSSDLTALGVLLRRVHQLPVKLPVFDTLSYLQENLQAVLEGDSSANLEQLSDCAQWLEKNHPSEPVVRCPCHNDCLPANIIKTADGLVLIDWEYAAAVDPAFELAAVCVGNKLDNAQKTQLLKGYEIGAAGAHFNARLDYFEKYYRLIDILWWEHKGVAKADELCALSQLLRSG